MKVDQLKSLIDNNQHLEHQYRNALQFATHKGLKKFLLSQALQRSAFLIELQDQLEENYSADADLYGNDSTVSTTIKTAVTPVYWMKMDKQTLFSSSEVILETFLNGEKKSLEDYSKHLTENSSSAILHKILDNQKLIITEMLSRVKKIDDL